MLLINSKLSSRFVFCITFSSRKFGFGLVGMAGAKRKFRNLIRTEPQRRKTMKHIMKYAIIAVLAITIASNASAENLSPPVSGLQVLDLAGGAVDTSYHQYTANFVASTAASTVTFTFRHDPGFFAFDDASVVNITNPGGNLLTNGNFETGGISTPPTAPSGWTYFQQVGVTFLGFQTTATGGLLPHSGNQFWYDGATEGYDGISQTFATAVGDTYQISFWLNQNGANRATYQQISTNGQSSTLGDGIDVVVYAGNGLPPTSAPEPTTMLLLGLGLVGLVGMRKR
jgi:hypothetical protein